MSKSKAKQKTAKKAKDAKKQDHGTAEIKRAQKRLAKAIREMDAAQLKVQKRESDLEDAMKRHGVLPTIDESVDNGAVEPTSDSPEPVTEEPDSIPEATSESDG